MVDPILRFLYDYGHFRNPLFPDTWEITEHSLDDLELDHPLVIQAIASFQSFDANMDMLTFKHHNRLSVADGLIGPATRELMGLERCGFPDYVENEASGSGSWPVGCLTDGIHHIRIDVDESNKPTHYTNGVWDSIKSDNAKMYGEIGLLIEYVEHGELSEVDMKWKILAGGTIGLAQFNDRTCGDNVFQYIDPGYRGSYARLVALHAHETGHNCNLRHTRGGVMNPSIMTVPLSWKNDVSYSVLKRFFGGEPIDKPDDDKSEVNGVLTVDGKLYKIKGAEV